MFSWVCPRCGHEVPPSKTECPFCTPPAPEPVAPPPPQQYQPPPQYAPPGPPPQTPPQYAQQAPPQYWQPLGPPPPPPQQYPPQGAPPQQYPPQYAQQPPQYWQPQQQYPPQQYPPQQYQPVQEQPPQQYQPPPPPPPPPQEPPPQQYQPPPPPQYAPAPPQYAPAPPAALVEYKQAEYRQPEPVQSAPTPWPPPEEQTGKPAWLVGVLAFVGVLVLLGIVYFVIGSHSSSSAKDASKQQITNPLQKYVEVVGIRIVSDKGGEAVKFLAVNHGSTELNDLTANVTLWASTQRSEEDSVGTFTFHVDTLGPDESKELSAPLKTDKGPAEMPDDWRNITADVQIAAAQ